MRIRSRFAVALAALLAVPLAAVAAPPRKAGTARPATAAAAPAPAPASQQLMVGGLVGGEWGTFGGLALRVDGEMPIQALTPKVNLSGVGSIGYSHFSRDLVAGEVKSDIFSAIPAARFSIPASPELTLYGDAGLGLYFGRFATKQTLPAPLPSIDESATKVGIVMRFAAGGAYALNPKTKLTAELGLKPYFGEGKSTNFTLGVGAMFAL